MAYLINNETLLDNVINDCATYVKDNVIMPTIVSESTSAELFYDSDDQTLYLRDKVNKRDSESITEFLDEILRSMK